MNDTKSKSLDPRRAIAIAYDLGAVSLSWFAAFSIAFGFVIPPSAAAVLLQTLPVVAGIQFAFFAWSKLYRGIWRFASLHDFRQIAKAILLSMLVVTAVIFMWSRGALVPRSALVLHPLMVVVLMCGGRIAYRWWKEQRPFGNRHLNRRPVIVLASGDSSYRLVLQLAESPTWEIVGLLDDTARRVGRMIAGFPILGGWDDLERVARDTSATHVLLSIAATERSARRRAFDLCARANLRLLVVPDIHEVPAEGLGELPVRKIEVDDLLGREPVELDVGGMREVLTLQCVLVTGAGGSIGSELCRQIARFRPRRLVLFELSEFALYQIHEALARDFPDMETVPIVGDIKDERRLFDVFASHSPSIVFHAAAYKHVPLMETHNAWQAVRNNVLGTVRLLEAISRFPVERFVLISTDKAVNPTSVMGASKRLAEMLVQRWGERSAQTRAVIVRFGNVLGSTGSVVPKFREQIARGGPITITHPEIKRYFMSVSEASQLVLQAATMGNGGEIFVLEMGEPVLIESLARDMIRLSGLPLDAIRIEYTGLRPGGKHYEELLSSDETTLPTRHPKLRVSRALERPDDAWERVVLDWLASSSQLLDADVRASLLQFVPEYRTTGEARGVVIPLRAGTQSRSSA
ncbi:MAG: nucleoside-diphosphate sugar epimerase/dehydratase [Burkholderiaceae bacterium]